LIIAGSSFIDSGVGSKDGSLGQMLEKSCKHSCGHTLDPVFIKLAQNVCPDNTWVKSDHGWVLVKR